MKFTELREQVVDAGKMPTQPDGPEEYVLTFTDKVTREVIWLRLPVEVRDEVIRKLSGSGIVVSRDMPRVH